MGQSVHCQNDTESFFSPLCPDLHRNETGHFLGTCRILPTSLMEFHFCLILLTNKSTDKILGGGNLYNLRLKFNMMTV